MPTRVLLNRRRSTELLAGLITQYRNYRTSSGQIRGFLSAWVICARNKDAIQKHRGCIFGPPNVDPNGISYNNLAWLAALKDHKFKEALDYANRAIALKPDQPDFLDTRGMVYLAAGERQLALDDLQRAVAYDPLSASKHYHLAQAFLDNNDKEKAKRSLETAKAKGFTPNGLDALEQPSYPNFLKRLESP